MSIIESPEATFAHSSHASTMLANPTDLKPFRVFFNFLLANSTMTELDNFYPLSVPLPLFTEEEFSWNCGASSN